MQIVIVAITAALASLLTFFSGFGLATILTPVMLIFFPVEIAIALTGIVHFLNNVFKTFLTWRNVNWPVVLMFGIPAIAGAFAGAKLLLMISSGDPLFTYKISEKVFYITAVKLMISILLIIFALFELIPEFRKLQFKKNRLFVGGLISGFFGGLSGHQGALRSAFLLKTGLNKEQYIATGIVIAMIIDITRLFVYYEMITASTIKDNAGIIFAAAVSAFAGAYAGSKLLKQITIDSIRLIVAVMIMTLALCLGAGLI